MKVEHLIRMYKNMRIALLISVPVAVWGFMLWLSQGEMLASFLFGIGALLPIIDILPSPTEVRRTLKTRETTGHIWYMVEYQDGTVAKM